MSSIGAGTVIGGRYSVIRLLGEGGFGEVYAVQSPETAKPLALKLLRARVGYGAELADKVRREAYVVDAVAKRTVHVPRVYEGGIDIALGRAWFVMDLLEGCSLAELIERRVTNTGHGLSLPELHTVLVGVADALRSAHAQDLVHCDLKPENIYLARSTTEGQWCMPYVLDFGVAKLRTDKHHRSTSTAHGTLPWMAPEQLEGGQITPAADQWSFAQIVYWMFVGARFPPTEVQRSSPVRWAMGRGVLIPASFDQWFERATRNAPSERFASIAEAYAVLLQVLAQQPSAHQATQQAPAPIASPVMYTQSPHGQGQGQTPGQPQVIQHKHNSPPNTAKTQQPKQLALAIGLAMVCVSIAVVSIAQYVQPSTDTTRRVIEAPPSRTTADPPLLHIQTQPRVQAALTQWQGFVENHGDFPGILVTDVYLPVAKLRTFGPRDSANFQSWWHEWAREGSTFSVDVSNAQVRMRPIQSNDNDACAGFGPLFEVRVPVVERLGTRGPQARAEQPYDVVQGIYTVRFVQNGPALKVCHENWRLQDFCPGHELAPDCRRYRSATGSLR